jgi:hypothetical protein
MTIEKTDAAEVEAKPKISDFSDQMINGYRPKLTSIYQKT